MLSAFLLFLLLLFFRVCRCFKSEQNVENVSIVQLLEMFFLREDDETSSLSFSLSLVKNVSLLISYFDERELRSREFKAVLKV